jgi:transposase
MTAYSMDLRVRVLADSEEGLNTTEIARKQRVSPAWVWRLKQRRRETGGIAPRRSGHAPPQKLAGQEERLRTYIQGGPEATLGAMRRDLGLAVRLSTFWRKLKGLGLTLKKRPAGDRAVAFGRGRPPHPVASGAERHLKHASGQPRVV